jgi:hypothetical protein
MFANIKLWTLITIAIAIGLIAIAFGIDPEPDNGER